ncbi:MAG: hypothetical protein MZV63_58440 [Marinilabiliales bacterium]|nr:hypothetical protein [Marinilabiliales bacterium]
MTRGGKVVDVWTDRSARQEPVRRSAPGPTQCRRPVDRSAILQQFL